MGLRVNQLPVTNRPSGKLYLAVSQLDLISGIWTDLELDTIAEGFTDGIEDVGNHWILPGPAGLYLIIAQVTFDHIITHKTYNVAIWDAITARAEGSDQPAEDQDSIITVSTLRYLAAGDHIEVHVQSRALVDTVDILQGADQTFLAVQRIR